MKTETYSATTDHRRSYLLRLVLCSGCWGEAGVEPAGQAPCTFLRMVAASWERDQGVARCWWTMLKCTPSLYSRETEQRQVPRPLLNQQPRRREPLPPSRPVTITIN